MIASLLSGPASAQDRLQLTAPAALMPAARALSAFVHVPSSETKVTHQAARGVNSFR